MAPTEASYLLFLRRLCLEDDSSSTEGGDTRARLVCIEISFCADTQSRSMQLT